MIVIRFGQGPRRPGWRKDEGESLCYLHKRTKL